MKVTWIAEERVVFVFKDGRRAHGRIAVALPFEGIAGDWGCPFVIDGLGHAGGPIYGASSLQALLLALRLVAKLVDEFQAKGGRIVDPHEGHEFPLDAVFGALVAR